jgi:acetyl-CoA carboxylase biotin carboxylase subunit
VTPATTGIRRVLIANRGEIAVRIARACRELGIHSIAVYSEIDAGSVHVRAADEAVLLGPAPAAESYLSVSKLIEAARSSNADAIHPGYGFLSERPDLAEACAASRLIFVGPDAHALRKMGSKIEARRIMAAAGVPVVPGETPADQSEAGLHEAAKRLGFPLLVKASAGGGGKGMRTVLDEASLEEAVEGARREATAYFGDPTLYVERLLDRPRHVEIQILADHHGHVVHLFERECSAQRRHQKIVEESPSTAIDSPLRARMGEAAVAAARAVAYRNAGTIEFLVDGTGNSARFYFLEMNTRLQVEHPVTEAVTDVDLVQAQIRIAEGAPLPWTQDQLAQRGHAIECRVYAEDPVSFLPQAGRIALYREPSGAGIRVDSGVAEGSEVSVHYDPLLAKLIVFDEDREAAIRRADAALRQFAILGIRTNLPFLLQVLRHPAFTSGIIDVGFVDREHERLLRPPEPDQTAAAAAVCAVAATNGDRPGPPVPRPRVDPWDTLTGWRN